MVQKNEKGHNFDPDTGTCTRCGMTVQAYEDHGKPPCRGHKGERPLRSARPEGEDEGCGFRRSVTLRPALLMQVNDQAARQC